MPQPTFFVAYMGSQKHIALNLRNGLRNHGCAAEMDEDLPLGDPLATALQKKLRYSSYAVFVIGPGDPSHYLHAENHWRMSASLPIIPVLVGADVLSPPGMDHLPSIRISGESDLEQVVTRLVDLVDPTRQLRPVERPVEFQAPSAPVMERRALIGNGDPPERDWLDLTRVYQVTLNDARYCVEHCPVGVLSSHSHQRWRHYATWTDFIEVGVQNEIGLSDDSLPLDIAILAAWQVDLAAFMNLRHKQTERNQLADPSQHWTRLSGRPGISAEQRAALEYNALASELLVSSRPSAAEKIRRLAGGNYPSESVGLVERYTTLKTEFIANEQRHYPSAGSSWGVDAFQVAQNVEQWRQLAFKLRDRRFLRRIKDEQAALATARPITKFSAFSAYLASRYALIATCLHYAAIGALELELLHAGDGASVEDNLALMEKLLEGENDPFWIGRMRAMRLVVREYLRKRRYYSRGHRPLSSLITSEGYPPAPVDELDQRRLTRRLETLWDESTVKSLDARWPGALVPFDGDERATQDFDRVWDFYDGIGTQRPDVDTLEGRRDRLARAFVDYLASRQVRIEATAPPATRSLLFNSLKPIVVVANHSSFLDMLILQEGLRQLQRAAHRSKRVVTRCIRAVVAEQVFRRAGERAAKCLTAIDAIGVVPFSGDADAKLEMKKEWAATLRPASEGGRGEILVVLPEGTRSYDGSLGTFLPSFAEVAQETNASIVPVAIRGSFDVLKKWHPSYERASPGTVHLRFLDPIAAGSASDQYQLALDVRGSVLVGLQSAPPTTR